MTAIMALTNTKDVIFFVSKEHRYNILKHMQSVVQSHCDEGWTADIGSGEFFEQPNDFMCIMRQQLDTEVI